MLHKLFLNYQWLLFSRLVRFFFSLSHFSFPLYLACIFFHPNSFEERGAQNGQSFHLNYTNVKLFSESFSPKIMVLILSIMTLKVQVYIFCWGLNSSQVTCHWIIYTCTMILCSVCDIAVGHSLSYNCLKFHQWLRWLSVIVQWIASLWSIFLSPYLHSIWIWSHSVDSSVFLVDWLSFFPVQTWHCCAFKRSHGHHPEVWNPWPRDDLPHFKYRLRTPSTSPWLAVIPFCASVTVTSARLFCACQCLPSALCVPRACPGWRFLPSVFPPPFPLPSHSPWWSAQPKGHSWSHITRIATSMLGSVTPGASCMILTRKASTAVCKAGLSAWLFRS